MPHTRKPGRQSYGWALHFQHNDRDVRALSPTARKGLEYAQALARNARERREAALFDDFLPDRLTPAELATDWDSAISINSKIKQARTELFGRDLSRSGIYNRLKKRKRASRSCAHPGCHHQLPPDAHGNSRYCPTHAAGAARVHRHRHNPAAASTDLTSSSGSRVELLDPLEHQLRLQPPLQLGQRQQIAPRHQHVRLQPPPQHRSIQRHQPLQPRPLPATLHALLGARLGDQISRRGGPLAAVPAAFTIRSTRPYTPASPNTSCATDR